MKVNLDIIRRWVAALRSGKYTQGRGGLRRYDKHGPDTYCCLGVLCDLHSQETNTPWGKPVVDGDLLTYGTRRVEEEVIPEATSLPTEVMEWAGLENNNPQVRADRSHRYGDTAIDMNDGDKATFYKIADAIEKFYLNEEDK